MTSIFEALKESPPARHLSLRDGVSYSSAQYVPASPSVAAVSTLLPEAAMHPGEGEGGGDVSTEKEEIVVVPVPVVEDEGNASLSSDAVRKASRERWKGSVYY